MCASVECSVCRTADLEAAFVDSCDFATLKNIARSRPVPDHLRAKVWQVSSNKLCHRPCSNNLCIFVII